MHLRLVSSCGRTSLTGLPPVQPLEVGVAVHIDGHIVNHQHFVVVVVDFSLLALGDRSLDWSINLEQLLLFLQVVVALVHLLKLLLQLVL